MIPHPPSDLERELFSLPVSLGGLGICDPYQVSGEHYSFSRELSRPLVDLILQQCVTLPHDVIDSQCVILKQLSQAKHQSQVDTVQSVLARSPHNLRLLSGEGSMGLPFIRPILQMLCVYAMAGSHHTYLLTMFAAKPLPFLMLSAARTVLFPSSTIMMYAI